MKANETFQANDTMKAMVLTAFDTPLELRERPIPQVGPNDVLIRVHACGVGLTLKHIRHGESVWITVPRIIGHEVGGTIAAIGTDVRGCALDDRVAVYLYLTCGDCEFCVSGRESLCIVRGGSVGTAIDGGFAEYIRVPARNVIQVPDEVSLVDAGIAVDAIATPWHVATERAHIKPNDVVLVIGAAGGLGIHMIQVAKVFGARVIGADVSDERLAVVREFGADDTINVRDEDPIEAVMRLTGKVGVDVAVDTVGSGSTMPVAIGALARGGTAVQLGHYTGTDQTVSFETAQLRHGRTFTSVSYCTRQHVRESFELIRRGLVRPAVLQTYALEAVNEALALVDESQLVGRTAVVLI